MNLLALLLAIPLWIGISGIRKWAPPGTGAQAMTIGLAMLVAAIVPIVGLLFALLGLLVISVGFAVHGLHLSRLRDRALELEDITSAQAQELDALRDSFAGTSSGPR